ncbi:MAG: ABC-2 family transporter protein [Planctomycetota bacterium]|nr:ABC-2 family transporter protein [Planctomycetota bacterium]
MQHSSNTDIGTTAPTRPPRASYRRVFLTFARNSLIRDMTFRTNFVIECISALSWMFMNLGLYLIIFGYTDSIGAGTGWGKYQFFVFLSTTLFINSLIETFFMPNTEEFSEQVRTGGLDFALLKPIDTQFLVSFGKMDWSSLANFLFAIVLLSYSLSRLEYQPGWIEFVLYPLYVLCGVAILYSLMIALAALSVWLGRNQNLYDFWFYITSFSRYPMEIYNGPLGTPLQKVFTFIIPVLIVVNVPARILAQPMTQPKWQLAVFALGATVACLGASRWLFLKSLDSYRSASS